MCTLKIMSWAFKSCFRDNFQWLNEKHLSISTFRCRVSKNSGVQLGWNWVFPFEQSSEVCSSLRFSPDDGAKALASSLITGRSSSRVSTRLPSLLENHLPRLSTVLHSLASTIWLISSILRSYTKSQMTLWKFLSRQHLCKADELFVTSIINC